MRLVGSTALLIILLATSVVADKYDEEANRLLNALDDKQHPVLPEIYKADTDTRQAVFRNTADEANDCLGFYYSVGVCMSGGVTTPPPGYVVGEGIEVLQSLKHDEKTMMFIALALTHGGGLDRETVKDTINERIADNFRAMHKDCGNISILFKNDKASFCQALGTRPSARLRYWLELLRK